MTERRRRLLAGFAAILLSALCATTDMAASGGSTPASGRCQQCDWYSTYCTLGGYHYDTCHCANVFDGNKICRCVANRRDCTAWCEEGGGACSGELSGRNLTNASGATWAWADRAGTMTQRCPGVQPGQLAGSPASVRR
jgi:hypothetical protein